MHTPTSMLLKAVYAACMHTKTDLAYGNAAMQFIIWSTIEQAAAHSFAHAQHMNIIIATCTHVCAICTGTQIHTVTNTPSVIFDDLMVAVKFMPTQTKVLPNSNNCRDHFFI